MAATWALGTLIQRQNPATLVYQSITGLGDITGPLVSVDILDVTSHSSPNSSEEIIPTVHRTGEISAPMYFDGTDTLHLAIYSDKATKRLGNWKIVLTDSTQTEITFTAYVVGLDFAMPVTGGLTQTFRLRPTGGLTITP